MRFLAVFLLVLVVAVGSSMFVDGERQDEAFVAVAPTPAATPTPTPAPTATPIPTPTPSATTVSLAFTGEILSHGLVISQAKANGNDDYDYDYRPMYRELSPLIESVDFAICHIETPVSTDDVGLSGFPIFNAPAEMPTALKQVGYDACSTASNHSLDQGPDGVIGTLNQMEAAGLPQAGMARTRKEKRTPTLYDIGGVTVGHLSYTYGLNGFVLPEDRPFLVNVTDQAAVLKEAAAAKAAGADFVVLSIQWGNEYQAEPSPEQVELAQAVLASPDIDLIIGAHVHVVQPVDVINGKYVFYGIGNSLSNQSSNCCVAESQNGMMAFVDITGGPGQPFVVTDASFVPTRVDRSDYTIVPLPLAVEARGLDDATVNLYNDVIAQTTEVVNRLGANLEVRGR